MDNEILIAGGTGDLGGRIIKALINKGTKVKAIVREDSKRATTNLLASQGVQLIELDMNETITTNYTYFTDKPAINKVDFAINAILNGKVDYFPVEYSSDLLGKQSINLLKSCVVIIT